MPLKEFLYVKVDIQDPGGWAKIAFCAQKSINIKSLYVAGIYYVPAP